MIWWLGLGCKDRYTPDSIIKFDCEMNISLINEEEDCNICVGPFITWCKLNCDEIFSVALSSIAVMSFFTSYLISH